MDGVEGKQQGCTAVADEHIKTLATVRGTVSIGTNGGARLKCLSVGGGKGGKVSQREDHSTSDTLTRTMANQLNGRGGCWTRHLLE